MVLRKPRIQYGRVWGVFLKKIIFGLEAKECVDQKNRKVVQVEVNSICKDPVKRESIANKGLKYWLKGRGNIRFLVRQGQIS